MFSRIIKSLLFVAIVSIVGFSFAEDPKKRKCGTKTRTTAHRGTGDLSRERRISHRSREASQDDRSRNQRSPLRLL